MGNFLYNVNKSREEWLKKPNPIRRAVFLNANLNTSLVQEAQATTVLESNLNPESVLEPISETELEPEQKTE